MKQVWVGLETVYGIDYSNDYAKQVFTDKARGLAWIEGFDERHLDGPIDLVEGPVPE